MPRLHPDYLDFVVTIIANGDGLVTRLISSPDGDMPAEETFIPPFPGDQAGRLSAVVGRDLEVPSFSTQEVSTQEAIGQALFDALIRDSIRERYLRCLVLVEQRTGKGLRMRLSLDPSQPGIAAVAALPWELMWRSATRDFLSRRIHTPFLRTIAVNRLIRVSPITPPLRVLVVMTSPEGLPVLDLEREWRLIQECWENETSVKLDLLRPPTLDSMYDTLRSNHYHVLHFMGHGSFNASNGGSLLFESQDRRQHAVSGAVLAENLNSAHSLRLVVLNACRTGTMPQGSGIDPFNGVASALAQRGMPAVVAMQHAISDQAAITLSKAMYKALAAGDPLDTAVTDGRLKIFNANPESPEWAVPVLYLRHTEEKLLAPGNEVEEPATEGLRSHIVDYTDYIRDKTRGFVGRQFVFDAVTRFTEKHDSGYLVLKGDPGIGKTSILAEMVKRWHHVHHFNIRASADSCRPEHFFSSTCARLIVRHGLPYRSLPPEAGRSSKYLCKLLREAGSHSGGKRFVLVDALDEVDPFAGDINRRTNILDLPRVLPVGVYLVLTTRRDESLQLRFDCAQDALDIVHDSPDNLADIVLYIRSFLPREGIGRYLDAQGITSRHFVDDMVARSEGNFMYLRYVLPEIKQGDYARRSLDEIPVGLNRYYEDHWQRMRERSREQWFELKLPVLAALTVVKQPVSIDFICGVLDRPQRAQIAAVLNEWQQFMHQSTRGFYRLYHGTFYDFIVSKNEVAEEQVGLHKMSKTIGRYVRDQYRRQKHLRQAGRSG